MYKNEMMVRILYYVCFIYMEIGLNYLDFFLDCMKLLINGVVPFVSALQIQASWSYAEDVNFLASGYNRPKFGSAGSGIYLGILIFVLLTSRNKNRTRCSK